MDCAKNAIINAHNEGFMSKKIPPFGEVIAAYQLYAHKFTGTLYIYTGTNAVIHAEHNFLLQEVCTYVLPGQDHLDFEWQVKGMRVVIVDTGGQSELKLKKFAATLLSSKAMVVVIHTDLEPLKLYRK